MAVYVVKDGIETAKIINQKGEQVLVL